MKGVVLSVRRRPEDLLLPLAPTFGAVFGLLAAALVAAWSAMLLAYRLIGTVGRLINLVDRITSMLADSLGPTRTPANWPRFDKISKTSSPLACVKLRAGFEASGVSWSR